MNILIIDDHPDPSQERFCHALAAAHKKGAESVRNIVLLNNYCVC